MVPRCIFSLETATAFRKSCSSLIARLLQVHFPAQLPQSTYILPPPPEERDSQTFALVALSGPHTSIYPRPQTCLKPYTERELRCWHVVEYVARPIPNVET